MFLKNISLPINNNKRTNIVIFLAAVINTHELSLNQIPLYNFIIFVRAYFAKNK